MKQLTRNKLFITALLLCFFTPSRSQEVLPKISAKNLGGRIVISWKNEYAVSLSGISIQRSFDSLKNYSTIGSVLNPANKENGYADANPPYERMYYRVFIGFENGTYIYSDPVRAAPDENMKPYGGIRYTWQYIPPPPPPPAPPPAPAVPSKPSVKPGKTPKDSATKPQAIPNKPNAEVIAAPPAIPEEKKPVINYLYLNRDQNVTLYLPGAEEKSYSVIFFEENGRQVFTLNKPKEELLIIEKVNFMHSGWFMYEIYEEGKLLSKEKIFIPKDQKPGAESRRQAN